jgi:hypothetical protein
MREAMCGAALHVTQFRLIFRILIRWWFCSVLHRFMTPTSVRLLLERSNSINFTSSFKKRWNASMPLNPISLFCNFIDVTFLGRFGANTSIVSWLILFELKWQLVTFISFRPSDRAERYFFPYRECPNLKESPWPLYFMRPTLDGRIRNYSHLVRIDVYTDGRMFSVLFWSRIRSSLL